MTANDNGIAGKEPVDLSNKPASRPADPEWAAGLKQLYDSVIDEDLPDSFKDLLSKLDKD